VLVDWLVGHHLLSRDLWPYVIIFINMCGITFAMVWSPFAVKGLWLCGIITIAIVVLLKEGYNFFTRSFVETKY
jgi:hypothetical protein